MPNDTMTRTTFETSTKKLSSLLRQLLLAAAVATASVATIAACTEDTGSAQEPLPPVVSAVAAFDGAKFELAEGLAVRDGDAYITLAPLGQIMKVTSSGAVAPYAAVPPGYNDGYTLGLAFDGSGALYVAQTRNSPGAKVVPGIYKIPAGGSPTPVTAPFATNDAMTFPNGIAVTDGDALLVTDSAAGVIFRVSKDGAVSRWKESPELAGSPACPGPLPFPIGVNGIIRSGNQVFVTNTAKGSIARIAVNVDGTAGAVTNIVEDCKYLGLDGLASDRDGSLLVVQNGSPGRVLRVTTAGAVTTLHDGVPLDGPGSIALADGWNGKTAALVTSTAFFSTGVAGAAGPGVVQLVW